MSTPLKPGIHGKTTCWLIADIVFHGTLSPDFFFTNEIFLEKEIIISDL